MLIVFDPCVPNTIAVGENAFHRGVVEGQLHLPVQVILPEDTEEVNPLLGLLYRGDGVCEAILHL